MKKKSVLKQAVSYLKPYTLHTVASLVLSVIYVGLSLYVPILIGRAIDCIVKKGDVNFTKLASYLATAVVCIGAAALVQWVISVINNRITFKVVSDIREDAFSKLQNLPLAYLDAKPSGDTVSRIIADVDTFADGLLMGFSQFFTGIMTIIGTLIFMFMLNFWTALAVVVITPLSLFTARFVSKHTYDMFREQAKLRADQTSVIDETVNGQKIVKAFLQEEKVMEKYDGISDSLAKASVKATFFSSLVNPTTRFINSLVYAAAGTFGALSVIGVIGGGAMTVGTLSSFLSYANQYTKPFNEISGVITELQNAIACAAHIFELINEKTETEDGNLSLKTAKGDIKLCDVSFSYTPERKLIENLNLSVASGQRIAIVGPTGCGKTTLINLLMRFYDVNSGKITVDGKDIRDIPRHDLRRNYGMVLQETWLKSGTVKENIAFSKPDATDEEIVAAAKAAHAHGFIKRLPNGYDTFIKSSDGQLSQGQRQLLCIARTMLALPPMLILDEATSSIDTRTELKIQKAFAKMMQGRTSFIVAHRLSTIKDADIIIVMKDGHIIETGNHSSLLKKDGFYAKLYNSQFANI